MGLILILFAVVFAVDAMDNDYCNMRSLCPQREHLGCSFNEKSWSLIRTGPIPMKRSSDIDANEKQVILDLHNAFRRATAYGQNDTQTPSRTVANMRELRWNEELAYLARIRVTLFNLGRSGSDCANLPKYQVGMNQHTQSFPVAPTDSTPWQFITKYWYSYSRFVAAGLMTDLGAFRDMAQFSQMLWPSTYEMGCAANNFVMPGAFMRNIICYYGPVAKCYDDTNPFVPGPPASACPDGTEAIDGLCSFSKTASPVVDTTTTSTTTESSTTTTTTEGSTTSTTTTEDSTITTTTEGSTTSTTTTEDPTTTTTTTTTEDPTTTTTTTEGSTTSTTTTEDPTTTTTTTEGSTTSTTTTEDLTTTTTTEGSTTSTTTTEDLTTTTTTEGSTTTTTTTEDPTTTTTTEGSTTPTTSTEKPTSTTSTEDPTTTTTTEGSTTTTTSTERSTSTTTTPTPTPVTTPCNSTSTPDVVAIKDPQEILIAVLRYICQLLAINPPDALISQMATNVTQTVIAPATAG